MEGPYKVGRFKSKMDGSYLDSLCYVYEEGIVGWDPCLDCRIGLFYGTSSQCSDWASLMNREARMRLLKEKGKESDKPSS